MKGKKMNNSIVTVEDLTPVRIEAPSEVELVKKELDTKVELFNSITADYKEYITELTNYLNPPYARPDGIADEDWLFHIIKSLVKEHDETVSTAKENEKKYNEIIRQKDESIHGLMASLTQIKDVFERVGMGIERQQQAVVSSQDQAKEASKQVEIQASKIGWWHLFDNLFGRSK